MPLRGHYQRAKLLSSYELLGLAATVVGIRGIDAFALAIELTTVVAHYLGF